jgi:hypothetical protein
VGHQAAAPFAAPAQVRAFLHCFVPSAKLIATACAFLANISAERAALWMVPAYSQHEIYARNASLGTVRKNPLMVSGSLFPAQH